MNSTLRIQLFTEASQQARLLELQLAFTAACNALAPIVQRTRCWNRVALHHLAYRAMREQFPALGSQMICNALYSVSRASRLVYQHPDSPFNLQRLGTRPLPCLRFLPQSPVYFDRHTLSLRHGQASMYTLDGRMRFNLPLDTEAEQRFRHCKLREIVLVGTPDAYALNFVFAQEGDTGEPVVSAAADLPDYLVVIDDAPGNVIGADMLQVDLHPPTIPVPTQQPGL